MYGPPGTGHRLLGLAFEYYTPSPCSTLPPRCTPVTGCRLALSRLLYQWFGTICPSRYPSPTAEPTWFAVATVVFFTSTGFTFSRLRLCALRILVWEPSTCGLPVLSRYGHLRDVGDRPRCPRPLYSGFVIPPLPTDSYVGPPTPRHLSDPRALATLCV